MPYDLRFTRTGLIFDLAQSGSGQELEDGIEYHRIGRDLVQELLEAIHTDPVFAGAVPGTTVSTLAAAELSVPRPPEAAFRAAERRHELPAWQRSAPKWEPAAEPEEELDDLDAPDAGEPAQVPTPAVQQNLVTQPVEAAPAIERSEEVATDPPSRSVDASRPVIAAESLAYTPDVFLGSSDPTAQYGVLGEVAGKRIALDLNGTHTISLFGVQGGGKSYTLGSIMEAASLPAPPVNALPRPLATVVFHYNDSEDYAQEFTSMVAPNDDAEQLSILQQRYGVQPASLDEMVLLVPEGKLEDRREEFPGITVHPLKFGSSELRAEHWKFLMGAVGNQANYIRQLTQIMRRNRNDLTLERLRQGIDAARLSEYHKGLAHQRLDLAEEYIDDNCRVKDLIRPGRVLVVDLRDGFLPASDALGLFVVLMQLFSEAQDGDQRFNKLVVFDEAHKYTTDPDLVSGMVDSVRLMRHKGMSVLVASQDPPSVPIPLVELSDLVILHKFNSPAWLKHLQKANTALSDLTPAKLAALTPGTGYVWAGKATDASFCRGTLKVVFRPRITRHGGATKTALAVDQ